MLSSHIKKYFDKVIDVVFAVILLFMMFAIAIGAFQLFGNIWELLKLKGITGNYIDIITDVLTLYVVIELSRSLVDYFDSHRIRLTFIVDAAIVFIIREMLIGLFKHKIESLDLLALSAVLLVLGALRIASIVVHDREKKANQG